MDKKTLYLTLMKILDFWPVFLITITTVITTALIIINRKLKTQHETTKYRLFKISIITPIIFIILTDFFLGQSLIGLSFTRLIPSYIKGYYQCEIIEKGEYHHTTYWHIMKNCIHTFSDGGKPCNHSNECQGVCIVNTNKLITTQCYYDENVFEHKCKIDTNNLQNIGYCEYNDNHPCSFTTIEKLLKTGELGSQICV